MDADLTESLQEAVRAAFARRTPVSIVGGGSKAFYGRIPRGEDLPVGGHRGIVHYEPSELVLTARCGTPLAEIGRHLAEHGQMLPFEPPCFGEHATLGGTIACGLAGPRRAYAGGVRDYLLGVRCLSGEGRHLRFGGEVVKNVAGFDAFRLMAGALGTLGVLLEASLKVLPRPRHTLTLAFDCDPGEAIAMMNRWGAQPLPITATAHEGTRLHVRLQGTEAGVTAARRVLGGEETAEGPSFWEAVREHRLPFFTEDGPLWRIVLPPATPPLPIVGRWFLEWGGALRWLRTALPPRLLRETVARHGGHAQLFRGGDREGPVFHPLPPALIALHKRIKQAFDPRGILNPGRMYPEW